VNDDPITVTDVEDGLTGLLQERINEFNVEATGFDDGRVLNALRRGSDGGVEAGLAGFTWGGSGYIDLLWVRTDLRRTGLGSRLLAAAEAEARARGCVRMIVSSHTFQAPDFYHRHGYVEYARTRNSPSGHADVHLVKNLRSDVGSPQDGRLIDVDDSLLCVVDVQPGFVKKIGEADVREPFVQRVVWLTALANALGVPTVVTEEEPDHNGPTLPEIVERLPDPTPRYSKPVFGLADDPGIMAAIEARGRRTAVLVGMETDVCVAQSALGLLDRGYRTVVVRDGVAAPIGAHDDGIERIRAAGATLIGAKGLFYEWVRTVDAARELDDLMASVPVPGGLTL
jgi:nicotinamidase-related amidase/GNAT superfamily N-acetyltransferase